MSGQEDGGGGGAIVGEVDTFGCGGEFVEGFVGGAVGEPAEVAKLEGIEFGKGVGGKDGGGEVVGGYTA